MCRNIEKHDKIVELARENGISRHDAEFLYQAYEQAKESDFGMYKIGCVIVSGGNVIGRGCNSVKTDPGQKHYNLKYRDFAESPFFSAREHSIHAELAALKSVSYPVAQKTDWSKAKAYIYRIAPGLPHKQGLSSPCPACLHALLDQGLRKVFYSTDCGFEVATH